jgi:hypothetical protein
MILHTYMSPELEEHQLTQGQKKLKKELETMLPHIGHMIIYKVGTGQMVAKGRLRRISFEPTPECDNCHVWYDNKPFPIKSYYDRIIKCETCSHGKIIA